ncbi:RNA polymerase sigma factor [Frankia sp. AiPs1]|uniref:RNA polymerase sigma factor n=1 Tax=Frankia sp. AiPs1 TaxID=573493 RepID=UPI0020433F28|nr:RNA polymerase sigma factor [Frankia sp. AiPs1]MCM3923597.1 RNA polymerase sigma factor [Frankia sp. AiPs1]
MGREPFEAVVERYGPMVLRVCWAVVGPTLAEDAWSETFLAALRAYPELRPGSSVEAWLVTIARNKAIDQLRAQSRRPAPTERLPESIRWEEPDASLDLWDALRRLPRKQRETVAYHYLAGLPYAEVARLLGGNPAAARRAGADGIASLRIMLAPSAQEERSR